MLEIRPVEIAKAVANVAVCWVRDFGAHYSQIVENEMESRLRIPIDPQQVTRRAELEKAEAQLIDQKKAYDSSIRKLLAHGGIQSSPTLTPQ